MATLATLLDNAELNVESLALIVDVDVDDCERWVATGTVPARHVDAVAEALNIDPGQVPAPARSQPQWKRGRTLSTFATVSIDTCAQLAFADPQRRRALAGIARINRDVNDAQTLYQLTAALLTLPRSTIHALRDLDTLLNDDNPLRVGAELGSRNQYRRTEIHRICFAALDLEQPVLRDAGDAALEVAEAVQKVAGDDDATQAVQFVAELYR